MKVQNQICGVCSTVHDAPMCPTTSKEMVCKVADDMNRFIILELPAPATHDERKQIAERIASVLNTRGEVRVAPHVGPGGGAIARCGGETHAPEPAPEPATLREYVSHKSGCNKFGFEPYNCTCGLDAALAGSALPPAPALTDDELLRLAVAAGFDDLQMRSMFYDKGPYEITLPTSQLRRFVESIGPTPPPEPTYTIRGWISRKEGCCELSDYNPGHGWEPVYTRSGPTKGASNES